MKRSHWQTLSELNDTPEVRALREKEFLTPSEEATEPSRRDFLKLIGAGAAFAAAGCARRPVEKILPYIKMPEEATPGKSVWYASTCGECPASCGILVKTREGRPIKLEGMKEHPLNRGGLCARGQASLLNLYDPDRLKGPVAVDRASGASKATTWGALDGRVAKALRDTRQGGGHIVLLTGTLTSPTTRALVADFLAAFPSSAHVVYDAVSSDAIAKAQELSYGERLIPRYRLHRADLIVPLGADPQDVPVAAAGIRARLREPTAAGVGLDVQARRHRAHPDPDRHERRRAPSRPPRASGVALALANELIQIRAPASGERGRGREAQDYPQNVERDAPGRQRSRRSRTISGEPGQEPDSRRPAGRAPRAAVWRFKSR
jgi:MoCo/4Fe-4S cofactor protein with predicted Tat translocation signal